MEVVPASVGEASRRWDDEHLDLQSAADGISGAPTGGFTANVSGTAGRFTSAWSRFASDAGAECEARADSLRTTIQDFLTTDDAAFDDLVALSDFLDERR
jgi:hypothetical protein